MNTSDEVDDDSIDEEVEEKLVFMQLDNLQEFNSDTQVDFVGLDQEKSLLNINGVTYVGQWEDAMGTYLFLNEKPNEHWDPVFDPTLKKIYQVVHSSDKLLKMSRCVITRKDETESDLRSLVKAQEDVNSPAESSDEEAIEEFYTSSIVKKSKSNNVTDGGNDAQSAVKLSSPENLEKTDEQLGQSSLQTTNAPLLLDDHEMQLNIGEHSETSMDAFTDLPKSTQLVKFLEDSEKALTNTNMTDEVILNAAEKTLSQLEDQSTMFDQSQDTLTNLSNLSVFDVPQSLLSGDTPHYTQLSNVGDVLNKEENT